MSAAIGGGSRRFSCSTFACCASMRKSSVSWPLREDTRFFSTERNFAPPSSASSACRTSDTSANEKNVSPLPRDEGRMRPHFCM